MFYTRNPAGTPRAQIQFEAGVERGGSGRTSVALMGSEDRTYSGKERTDRTRKHSGAGNRKDTDRVSCTQHRFPGSCNTCGVFVNTSVVPLRSQVPIRTGTHSGVSLLAANSLPEVSMGTPCSADHQGRIRPTSACKVSSIIPWGQYLWDHCILHLEYTT